MRLLRDAGEIDTFLMDSKYAANRHASVLPDGTHGLDFAVMRTMTTCGAQRIWGTLDPFVESGEILGRRVANAGFLDALLTRDPFDEYHFFLSGQAASSALEQLVRTRFPSVAANVVILPRAALPGRLASTAYHVFHLSDCLTSQPWLAAVRNRVAQRIFPITGVTHSLSYARFGPALSQHVWAGATARDCIVATSTAGAAMVRNALSSVQNHLPGAKTPCVETVPLGIWCRDCVSTGEPAAIAGDKIVFLIPGRISPYSKMDILPLLRAFQRLRRRGINLASCCVVLAGGTGENACLPGTLSTLAANIGLELITVTCPDDRTKMGLMRRADVVVSLADNPQETFGLTVLEAAAAGKPVIASDYDGYRDLVRHGETGLLVPTLDGGDELSTLMAPLLFDSASHLWLAQNVAVDVGILADHLARMFDADARIRMGAAAASHALSYDWPRVMDRYLDLWERLNTLPVPEPGECEWRHPQVMNYGQYFAGYPSTRLHGEHVLETTDLGRAVYRAQDYPVVYAGIEDRIDLDTMRKVLVWARTPIAWPVLQRKAEREKKLAYTVVWMLKGDLLRLC